MYIWDVLFIENNFNPFGWITDELLQFFANLATNLWCQVFKGNLQRTEGSYGIWWLKIGYYNKLDTYWSHRVKNSFWTLNYHYGKKKKENLKTFDMTVRTFDNTRGYYTNEGYRKKNWQQGKRCHITKVVLFSHFWKMLSIKNNTLVF